MTATLYYVHDPMCSWCWAFVPTWQRLLAQLPATIAVQKLLGGLAPDTDEPMPEDMRTRLQETWRRIEQRVPGIVFNHAFWTECAPRRATYPACRAVLAARQQGADDAMNAAIQRAYYQQARNPSDADTLIALAGELGLDVTRFRADLDSPPIAHALAQEMARAEALGVDSYPSLVLLIDGSRWPVAIDYNDTQPMLDTIHALLGEGIT